MSLDKCGRTADLRCRVHQYQRFTQLTPSAGYYGNSPEPRFSVETRIRTQPGRVRLLPPARHHGGTAPHRDQRARRTPIVEVTPALLFAAQSVGQGLFDGGMAADDLV